MRRETVNFARRNRQSMNEAEVRIWGELRRRQIGYRFRRRIRSVLTWSISSAWR